MSTRFFTSDPHIGHEFMARKRGFASAAEHDAEIVRKWNAEVSPRDTVFVLGDAAMGSRGESLTRFGEMHGTKILISGNHDNPWPGHKNFWTHLPLYHRYFRVIQPFARISVDGHNVLLSHFPYETDHTDEPRYTQFRLRDYGGWLLHGHTHSPIRVTSAREIHVGMDAWDLMPVAERRIISLIREQRGREDNDIPAFPRPEEPVPDAHHIVEGTCDR